MNPQLESSRKIKSPQMMTVVVTPIQIVLELDNLVGNSWPKRPYVAPIITSISLTNIILSHTGIGGDGDASLAQS